MIRLANNDDYQKLIDYLNVDPCGNLFIIGDIMLFGFESDIQKVWIDIEDKINCVYLLYRDNLCIYSQNNDYDFKYILEIIKNHEVNHINAIEKIAPSIYKYLDNFNYRKTHMAICDSDKNLCDISDIEIATKDDLLELANLNKTNFNEYINTDINDIYLKLSDTYKTYKFFIKKVDGKIVSSANASAKSDKAGMIVGVSTLKDYRNRGYASKCVSATIKDLLNEGKIACLFFDNPKAASVYYNLGFKDIGNYIMMGKIASKKV